jgi:hypothetical protein
VLRSVLADITTNTPEKCDVSSMLLTFNRPEICRQILLPYTINGNLPAPIEYWLVGQRIEIYRVVTLKGTVLVDII